MFKIVLKCRRKYITNDIKIIQNTNKALKIHISVIFCMKFNNFIKNIFQVKDNNVNDIWEYFPTILI